MKKTYSVLLLVGLMGFLMISTGCANLESSRESAKSEDAMKKEGDMMKKEESSMKAEDNSMMKEESSKKKKDETMMKGEDQMKKE